MRIRTENPNMRIHTENHLSGIYSNFQVNKMLGNKKLIENGFLFRGV